jgi:hypothetical protein
VFERWAEVLDTPGDTRVESVLLDFDQSQFADVTSETRAQLTIDDVAMPVDPSTGEFTITACDVEYKASVKWQPKSSKYMVECRDLDERFASTAPAHLRGARTLVDYLNGEQAFRPNS